MQYFTLTLQEMISFFFYAILGIIAVKTKILDERGLGTFSKIIVNVMMPLLVFRSVYSSTTLSEFLGTTVVLFLSILMFVLAWFLSLTLAKLFKLTGDRKRIYVTASIFGNCGFMGIPILTAIMPERGMIYFVMFSIVDSAVFWSLGAQLIGTREGMEKKKFRISQLKPMFNPAFIATWLGFIVLFTGITIPPPIASAIQKFGAATSPLAIFYLGGLFCFCDIIGSLKKIELYVMILVRMIFFPIVFYMMIKMIPGINQEICLALAVLTAMPSMSSIAILSKATNHPESGYAAQAIFLTTVFSLIVLPVVCYIIAIL